MGILESYICLSYGSQANWILNSCNWLLGSMKCLRIWTTRRWGAQDNGDSASAEARSQNEIAQVFLAIVWLQSTALRCTGELEPGLDLNAYPTHIIPHTSWRCACVPSILDLCPGSSLWTWWFGMCGLMICDGQVSNHPSWSEASESPFVHPFQKHRHFIRQTHLKTDRRHLLQDYYINIILKGIHRSFCGPINLIWSKE